LVAKKRGEGGLKREGGLIKFMLLKGGLITERGVFLRGLNNNVNNNDLELT